MGFLSHAKIPAAEQRENSSWIFSKNLVPCLGFVMQRKSAFSRRLPDLVTEELVAALLKKSTAFEFKQLFDIVYERLRARNAASGGEEMLRLRAYEKLQNLVSRGMVKKSGKKYKGLASLSKALTPADAPLAVK